MTTHWNHRVTIERVDGEEVWSIREVHYDGDAVVGWTVDPVAVSGDSLDDINWVLGKMSSAAQRQPLDLDAESARLDRVTEPEQ